MIISQKIISKSTQFKSLLSSSKKITENYKVLFYSYLYSSLQYEIKSWERDDAPTGKRKNGGKLGCRKERIFPLFYF